MIITITNKEFVFYGDPVFNMTVDIAEVCRAAGKREKNLNYYYDGSGSPTYVPYKIPKPKKVLKLIFRYADDGDIVRVSEYLEEHNQKLYKYWMGLCK